MALIYQNYESEIRGRYKMSKVLKVFVNLILILFILVAAALFVPPLAGITTVVSEPETVTNIQIGSVVYGKSTPVGELAAGDKIVVTGDGTAFVYEISEINAETGETLAVASQGAEPVEITLRTAGQKVLITVPFIGYVSILAQTMEGRIVLGLAVALLIVLFIVAEVWNRKNRDEEEEDPEEDEFYADLAEKKAEADAEEERKFQTRQLQEETGEQEAEQSWPAASQGESEVFIEKLEGEETSPEEEIRVPQTAEGENGEESVPDVQAALEKVLVKEPMHSQGQTMQMKPVQEEAEETASLKPDEIVLAIPARTVEEILQDAYKDGQDPKVEKDELTGVTFVDFSDCL